MNKTVIAIGVACLTLSTVSAFALSGPTEDLIAYRAISKDKSRLKCFDAAVAAIAESVSEHRSPNENIAAESSLSALVAAPSDENTNQGVLANSDDGFGAEDLKERLKKSQAKKPKQLSVSIVEIAQNKQGKYVIILENGQIWRQLKADTNRLRVPRKSEGLTAVIKRRSLGAHSFSIAGDKRTIKVERMK